VPFADQDHHERPYPPPAPTDRVGRSWKTLISEVIGRVSQIPMMQRLAESVLIHFDDRGTRVLLRHPLA
jgi:hypothetical protein